jgi:hypothetical protein
MMIRKPDDSSQRNKGLIELKGRADLIIQSGVGFKSRAFSIDQERGTTGTFFLKQLNAFILF